MRKTGEVGGLQAGTDSCPPDVEEIGRCGWTVIHSMAAAYPSSPSELDQANIRSFLRLFSKLYPCRTCASGLEKYMEQIPIQAGSRSELALWLCGAHNDVNVKLGKPIFNCSLWDERWRTGWKDGRCD